MRILESFKRSKPMAWARAAMLAGAVWLGGCSDFEGGSTKIEVIADAGVSDVAPESLACQIPDGVETCPEGEADLGRMQGMFEDLADKTCRTESDNGPILKGRAGWSVDCVVVDEKGLTCLPTEGVEADTTPFCASLDEQRDYFVLAARRCLELGAEEIFVQTGLNTEVDACGLRSADLMDDYGPQPDGSVGRAEILPIDTRPIGDEEGGLLEGPPLDDFEDLPEWAEDYWDAGVPEGPSATGPSVLVAPRDQWEQRVPDVGVLDVGIDIGR